MVALAASASTPPPAPTGGVRTSTRRDRTCRSRPAPSDLHRGADDVALGRGACGCPPGESGLDGRCQTLELVLLARVLALVELGHDLLGEELERFADVLVTVVARLAHEDHLVDARRLVALQQPADLVGRADRPPQRAEALLHQLGAEGLTSARCDVAVEPEQRAVLLELVPDHRSSGS